MRSVPKGRPHWPPSRRPMPASPPLPICLRSAAPRPPKVTELAGCFQPESGWETLGFDDAHWHAAVEIATNGNNPYANYGCIDGVSPDAYWIWTHGYEGQHRNVFCRGLLREFPIPIHPE